MADPSGGCRQSTQRDVGPTDGSAAAEDSTFLFGVRPLDPVTFAGVIVLIAVTAMMAAAVPALRASRVDPMIALRNN
jgi:ABC-type antimicrobial peptide transport system permease subunit